MAGRRNPSTVEALLVLGMLTIVVGGGLVGFFAGRATKTVPSATPTQVETAPSGHVGENLPVAAIGDPTEGEKLFEDKGCADCHSYGGQGGTDGPPLDYMAGHLSAQEIANMSGTIWDHLPQMLPHFEEEGIPVPTFADNQMADLIAFLHGGPSAAEASNEAMSDASGSGR